MTQTQFFAYLRGMRRQGWRFDYTSIRNKRGICPLAAAANKLTHSKKFNNGTFPEAGKRLGLPTKFIEELADAADGTWKGAYGRAEFVRKRRLLRKRLLAALDMQEVKDTAVS